MKLKPTNPAILAVLVSLLFAAPGITRAQTQVGLCAGMNFSNVRMEGKNGQGNSTKSTPGFQIGLTVDIPLVANFYLQPGALYSGKGFKQTDNWFAGSGNELKVNVSYFEVPLNLLYKPRLGSGKVLVGAGPYAAYGTGGSWKSEAKVVLGDIVLDNRGDAIFKKDVVNGEFGNYLYGKPWDFGANFLVGYEFHNKLSLQLNSQLGIKDLQPEVGGVKRGGKLKNQSSVISVGYTF
jgi:hypothetical protein